MHPPLTLGHIDHYLNSIHQFTHKVIILKDKIFTKNILMCDFENMYNMYKPIRLLDF